MPNSPPIPTPQEQWERYQIAKALHDDVVRAWKAAGRTFALPPRPIPPHTPGWFVPQSVEASQ